MESRRQKALLASFEAHADALFRHAYFRLSDRERAYDLVQDTYLKAWDYLEGGGQIRHYKSFLYRVLRNLIIDEYRKRPVSSLDELLDGEAIAPAIEAALSQGSLRQTEERFDEAALIGKIHERIPQLPLPYREVLTMRFIDGCSIGEIAAALGASENVVYVRIHRGIARLRKLCNAIHTL